MNAITKIAITNTQLNVPKIKPLSEKNSYGKLIKKAVFDESLHISMIPMLFQGDFTQYPLIKYSADLMRFAAIGFGNKDFKSLREELKREHPSNILNILLYSVDVGIKTAEKIVRKLKK